MIFSNNLICKVTGFSDLFEKKNIITNYLDENLI